MYQYLTDENDARLLDQEIEDEAADQALIEAIAEMTEEEYHEYMAG